MITADQHNHRIMLVARRAMRGYDELPAPQKIELLLGLAECLPETEKEAALHAAFCLQQAEAKQLHFRGLISTEASAP